MQEQRIQQLEQQVRDLISWKGSRERQQISYPIDQTSKNILNEGLFVPTGKFTSVNIYGLTDLLSVGIIFSYNNREMVTFATSVLHQFTVDSATDIVTSTGHGLSNGTEIALATDGVLPSGLDSITIYYVINSTSNTFKVSLTSGGSAVDIIDAGTGNHYWGKPLV